MPTTTAADESTTDGRRARRERGRRRVVEVMVDLLSHGQIAPTADEVAQRTGVSTATIFRYFPTLEDLRAETIAHFVETHRDLYEIPDLGAGDLDGRITRLVTARVDLFRTVAPAARLLRARALDSAVMADGLRERRRFMTDQIRSHFATELAARPPARRDDLVATLAAATSFEAWDLQASDLSRTDRQIRRAWTRALRSLLGDPSAA